MKARIYKKTVLCIIIILLLAFFTACSFNPVYYSKGEVMDYAYDLFGEDIDLIDKLEYTHDEADEIEMHEYIFEDKYGMAFSIYNYSDNVYFLGSETVFYEKIINNDYIERKITSKKSEIAKLISQSDIRVLFEDGNIQVIIENMDKIDEAAEFLYKLDSIVGLEYNENYSMSDSNIDTYRISISVRPNAMKYEYLAQDWYTDSTYTVTRIQLSNFENQRLDEHEIYETIERAIVYEIKEDDEAKYTLPDEILAQYPSQHLTVTNEELFHEEFSFTFNYDIETEKYYMENLDPCQESDEDFNYFEKGIFKFLVESLGGQYESSDYIARWNIGGDLFYAELERDDGYYKDFTLTKNGQDIELDDNGERNNGTVAGRGFSIEDLEKMLNVKIRIDDENQTATIEVLE